MFEKMLAQKKCLHKKYNPTIFLTQNQWNKIEK